MRKEILAYMAGLFDGEGCIHITKTKAGKYNHRSDYHQLQVNLVNTNKKVLDWIKNRFGGSVRRHDIKSRSKAWTWYIYTIKAKDFLKMIYPYLVIKEKQAKIAIEFRENRKNIQWQNKEFQLKEIARREKCRQEISKLNHGGDINAGIKLSISL
ncbi:hypothetical protein ES708_19435 [subsurface metagenome]